VRVFSTTCNSASITSSVSKWRPFNRGNRKVTGGQVRRVGWVENDSHVCCHDATAGSFVAKFRSEVFAHFHAVAISVTVVCTRLACFSLSWAEHAIQTPVYNSCFLHRTLV
jgi:hypothetical protein